MSVEAPATRTAPADVRPSGPDRTTALRIAMLVTVGGAVLMAIAVRFAARSPLWLDETITVNIARLPVADIPGALRQDGAPPLTYVLLHFWMQLFGSGTTAVRALSAVWGLLALPLAYFVGRRVGRTRGTYGARVTAITALLLVASSPFAARYATETRMYALQIVLVLVGYLALTNLLDRPGPGWAAAVALTATALLYNHYWSLYLVTIVAIGLLIAAVRAPTGRRRGPLYGLAALVVAGLAFLPWVPTLLYQLRHTGTPWAIAPPPTAGLAWTLVDFSGGDFWAAWPIVLALVLMFALAVFGKPDGPRTVLLDIRTVPGIRLLALAGFGTALLALTSSWVLGGAVQVRYAALAFPLLVVATAFGLTVFRDPRIVAGVLVFLTGLGLLVSWHSVTAPRTQAAPIAALLTREAKPGDVVVFCPDQLGPDTTRLLPEGLTLRAFPDRTDTTRVDWVDYPERMSSLGGAAYADRILAEAGNRTVWVVWKEGYRFVTGKCDRMLDRLSTTRVRSDRILADDTYGEAAGLVQFRP